MPAFFVVGGSRRDRRPRTARQAGKTVLLDGAGAVGGGVQAAGC